MATVRLLLAYDGTGFHGWARQPGVRTVQGELEEALGRILGERPRLSVAGRTDAGVHASGQVASFEGPAAFDLARAQRAVNAMLGPEVVVLEAGLAPAGFDARHGATAREYVYRIRVADWPDPFTAPYVWHLPGALGLSRMRAAARHLTGERDFASFCRRPPGGGTVRDLRVLAVARAGDEVRVRAVANAFLHQMVRSLTGTLVAVGEGRMEPDAMPEVLAARDRSAAGPVAPPQGLTLVRVRYGGAPSRRAGSPPARDPDPSPSPSRDAWASRPADGS